MNKEKRLSILLLVCLLSILTVTVVQAYVPPNFRADIDIFGSVPASRKGFCGTGILSTGPSYRAGVNCEMQTGGGTYINSGSSYGTYGGLGVSVTLTNSIGYTDRIVVFSTHNMWIDATEYIEYRMVSDG